MFRDIFLVIVILSFVKACQSQVLCSADIGFSAPVPWVDTECILPPDSNIQFDFVNASSRDPYNLECDGDSLSITSLRGVQCECRYSPPLTVVVCQGFVLDATASANSRVAVILASSIPPVLIILILLILAIILILVIGSYFIVKRRNKKVPRQNTSQAIHTNFVTSNRYSIPLPALPKAESRYSNVDFSDYDYVEMDSVEYFTSSSNQVSKNSEPLYDVIKQGKPRPTIMESIGNQLSDIRRTSTTNKSGRVSHIVVPSSEQRSSLRLDSSSTDTSFNQYIKFTSMPSNRIRRSLLSEEPIYMEPASNVGELYDQMADGKLLEINIDTITIGCKLGSGEFGDVSKGVWASSIGDLNVALKLLNKTDEQSNTAFLQEAAILGQFSHPNILRLVGVVTLTVPNMIVTELMQEELKRFLLALQTQHTQELDYDTLAPHFLCFSRQVASGMQHLAQRECIHRDIAARNILLTDKCVCKIADFGMSRRLEAESDYYRVKGANKLPVKWSAPEAIFFKRYTLKSDVWSYGMLLYEIWSVGRKPWPYEDNRSAVEKMARAVNLPPPSGCPRALYQLMVSTWHPKPDQRPDMNEVVTRLALPDEELLARPELEGKQGASAPAFTLGADPMAAEELYKDLQDKYVVTNSSCIS